MASLSLSGGTEQFSWRITGLSSAFNQANGYVRAGIASAPFTSGGTSISGIVDTVSAPASGGSTSTSQRWVGYSPGTYTFYAFTQVQDGRYWSAGSARVTVDAAAQRPANWSWWSTVAQGAAIQISAAEFRAFLDRINEFRVYTGLPEYGAFVYPSAGDVMTAVMMGHPVYAIRAMGPSIATPTAPFAGDPITAAFFNGLRNSLNSIA